MWLIDESTSDWDKLGHLWYGWQAKKSKLWFVICSRTSSSSRKIKWTILKSPPKIDLEHEEHKYAALITVKQHQGDFSHEAHPQLSLLILTVVMPGLWRQRHRSWQEYVWAPIFHPALVFCIVGAILTIGGQFSTAHPSFIDFVSKEIPFFYICICWFLNLYCICFILFGGNLLAGHVFTDFYQVLVGSRASRASHWSRFRGRGSVEALKKQLAPRLCTVYTQRSKSK